MHQLLIADAPGRLYSACAAATDTHQQTALRRTNNTSTHNIHHIITDTQVATALQRPKTDHEVRQGNSTSEI